MARLKYGLSGLSPGELILKALHVILKMTGNVNFVTPDPTLADVETAQEELADAEQATLDGGTDRTAERDLKYAVLVNQMQRLGNYVQMTSKGDSLQIISSGFEVVQRGGPIGGMMKPGSLEAEGSDMMGTMDLSWEPVRGASEYIIEMSETDPNDQAQWKLKGYSHKSSFTVEGLDSLKVYWFRVSALGTSGKGPYSDPARGVTQ